MKRLIVAYDGTWNNPDQEDNGAPTPTNVFKMHNAMADVGADGVKQLKYYHPGVGGEKQGIVSAVLGGALGVGISRHIKSGYHWLANNYEEGDEIYLYGFSRGAFTTRSLGGMLGRGLLDLRHIASKEAWVRVDRAFDQGYRIQGSSVEQWADDGWIFFNSRKPTPIHFVGVWDTVGALGVPDDLELLNILDDKKAWEFFDTSLGPNVAHARHAIAIDEIRASFTPTLWSNAVDHTDAKEVWFPGVHSDVGGGYADTDLSHGALKWMIGQSQGVGLAIRDGVLDSIASNPLGKMHNSYKGLFTKMRSRPRNIPAMVADDQQYHESAIMRQQHSPIDYSPYHPTIVLQVGDSVIVDVHADTRWNATNIFLPKGHEFVFSAIGEWQDSKDSCDWKGTENDEFTTGDVVRAMAGFWGKAEDVWSHATGNRSTDFVMTKRVEHLPWFSMVGAIANDGGSDDVVHNDGSPIPHQLVALPRYDTKPLKVKAAGYLYCFPNDVWSLYGNNHGSVQLKITRRG